MPEKSQLPDLTTLYDRLGIPPSGRRAVEHIRHSEPVRRVGSGRSNANVRFASRKMGHTVHCESRTVEYPFALLCEFDPEVIEFWDQSFTFTLRHIAKSGKRCAHSQTPDFLVISTNEIAFVECKSESELAKLALAKPNLFQRDENQAWRCPPGETAAAEYGLQYRVHSSACASSRFVRNAEFIYDYVQGTPDEKLLPTISIIVQHVQEKRIKRLDRLIREYKSPDAIYWAIATRQIYFDFSKDLLARAETAHVYADESYCQAIQHCSDHSSAIPANSISLQSGTEILWDNQPWQVINIGNGQYTLRQADKQLVTLSESQVSKLVRDRKITRVGGSKEKSKAVSQVLRASPTDLATANERMKALKGAENGSSIPCSMRTLRHWKKSADEALQLFGNPLLGLIPKTSARGNRTQKIMPRQAEVLSTSIHEHFLTKTARDYKSAYNNYIAQQQNSGIPTVSYQTYINWCKNISATIRTVAREGRKSAYQLGPSLNEKSELPPHGDRAFEIAHIDHTPVEIELVSSITGEVLGHPWLTLLIDAFSRVVLGHFLTFEKPSVRSVMMVIRDCVRRHGRLPHNIVVDRGAEFGSIYFESFCAMYTTNIINRPPGEPRFGSPIERQFGSTQSAFIYDLAGNARNKKLGRSLSASHQPGKEAIWTPDAFNARLEDWLYLTCPHLPHLGILEHPADRLDRSIATTGSREQIFIPFDELFILSSLPAPQPGTRKLRSGTISLNHMSYECKDALEAKCDQQKVPVRYDPYNALILYAFVDDRWLLFKNSWSLLVEYSERDILLVHMEVMARAYRAKKEYREIPILLRNFFIESRQREQILFAQRNINQLAASPRQTSDNTEIDVDIAIDEISDIASFVEFIDQ